MRILKGGSLSRTGVINEKYVRKEVDLYSDIEYGYNRWYSQLKRLQRYNEMFPDLFIPVLDFGVGDSYYDNKKCAYYTMPYMADSMNGYEYLNSVNTKEEATSFFNKLQASIKPMYDSLKLKSNSGGFDLYKNSDIDRPLLMANKNTTFSNFIKYDSINFIGEDIPSFHKNINIFYKLMSKNYVNPTECFTHGNLTLENILYEPQKEKIWLIDPYDETTIDSDLAEYSQLLQSSNSLYEYYNNKDCKIVENNIIMENINIPNGIRYFNDELTKFINTNYSKEDIISIKILEISQFIRIIPFKIEKDLNKAIFFYGLASNLLNNLINEK